MKQHLGSIKKWLGHKKKKLQGTEEHSEDAADRMRSEAERAYLRNEVAIVRGFVPQAKGTEATLEWLEQRTPDALSRLLNERDRAAQQNARGPKSKGTREVKEILMKPCRTTVEQLQHVRHQAEATVRYGPTGAVVYSLGQTLQRRRSLTPKLPSLQLKDFSTMVQEQLDAVSRLPGSALNSATPPGLWLDPAPAVGEASEAPSRRPSRGLSQRQQRRRGSVRKAVDKRVEKPSRVFLSPLTTDVDSSEDDPYEEDLDDVSPLSPPTPTAEEEWEAREATFVSIVQVPTQKVRKVHIQRRRRGEWRRMSRITEVSTPNTSSAGE